MDKTSQGAQKRINTVLLKCEHLQPGMLHPSPTFQVKPDVLGLLLSYITAIQCIWVSELG